MSAKKYLDEFPLLQQKSTSGAPQVEDDPIVTFRLFRLQEPEAPFQNATSRDWQKAFNPQRKLGAFCSGVKRWRFSAPAQQLSINIPMINEGTNPNDQ